MIIYKTINLINNKIYVGKLVSNNEHYYGSGKLIQNAIKKYGIENFKKEILEECETKEQLSEREKFWIKKLNSIRPNGYNISAGGDGGDTFTNDPDKEKRRKKIGVASKKRKHSEKTKEKMRIAAQKRRHSDETKKKIGLRTKGKTYEELYGIKRAKEIRRNKSTKMMGDKNPFYGKKHTEETKKINGFKHTKKYMEKK
jgi:group I intron endonuclease